jgi:hypothetical protein
MIVIPATLPLVLEALTLYWQAAPAYERAPPAAELAPGEAFEKRLLALGLPADFEHFYRAPVGGARALPLYAVEENFHFLTAAELRSCEQDWLVVSGAGAAKERARVTVFVDFMETSWEYGVMADPVGGYRIGFLAWPGEFKVITRSLATFLCLYLEDAPVLYDHRNPYVPDPG